MLHHTHRALTPTAHYYRVVYNHRNTPSLAVTYTSRTARTSPHPSILSQATSNRQSEFLPSDRAYNILHILCRMADVKVLTWGYKFTREIARRMPHFRGDVYFPVCKPATRCARAAGVRASMAHIVWSSAACCAGSQSVLAARTMSGLVVLFSRRTYICSSILL